LRNKLDTTLELANIIFSMSRGPESNRTYVQLLSTRWESDYEDIYDDLKEQGLQDLIKQPPI
jgi:type I restriction enzyme R subunit